MQDDQDLLDFAGVVLTNLPTFLALAAGALASGVLWRHYPAVALRTLVGCSWLAAVYLVSIAWHTIFELEIFPDLAGPGPKIAYLVLSLFEATGFAFLISAIFMGRFPDRYHRFVEQFPDDERDTHVRDLS